MKISLQDVKQNINFDHFVNIRKDKLYISLEQLNMYQVCPAFFYYNQNKSQRSKNLKMQQFNLLHSRAFEQTLGTVMSYFHKYKRPIENDSIIKNYLINYRKMRSSKTLIYQYGDVNNQVIEGAGLQFDTISYLQDVSKLKMVDKLQTNDVIYIPLKNLLDYDIDFRVYLRIKKPYIFRNKFPHSDYNLYYPYITYLNNLSNDKIYIDSNQLLRIYIMYRMMNNKINRSRYNINYYITYINPNNKDIYDYKFDTQLLKKYQTEYLNDFFIRLVSGSFAPKVNDFCLECDAYQTCQRRSMNRDNVMFNIINSMKNQKELKTPLNNEIYEYLQEEDIVEGTTYISQQQNELIRRKIRG